MNKQRDGILLAEGASYFERFLCEQLGAIQSLKWFSVFAFHSNKTFDDVKSAMRALPYSYLVKDFPLYKVSDMKDGRFNYVFRVVYHD